LWNIRFLILISYQQEQQTSLQASLSVAMVNLSSTPPPGVVESKIVNDKMIKESEFPTVDKEMPRNSQQNQQIHSFL
jgi:hypothetical protein